MSHNEFKDIANQILEKVGGRDNVISLTHCITRLRFTLKDESLANKDEVQTLPLVLSVIEKGGQYQVVIGNKVEKVYEELAPLLKTNSHEIESNIKKKGNAFDTFTSFIQGVFVPTLGFLTASGLLKGILNGLTATNIVSDQNSTILLLSAISSVIFYFFPIILGASAAKYLEMDMYIGMGIGGSLVYPSVINAATDGSINNFLGIPLEVSDYSSTVFPVLFAIIAAYWLQKLLKRFIPAIVSYIFVPFLTLVVIVPLTIMIIGPVITTISGILADIIVVVYNFSPILAGLVIGGPWIVFVMLGLHWAFIPIFIMNIAENGVEPLMGLLAGNQWAMAGATLGVALLLKDKEVKSTIFTNGITCILGVSEPSIYGVLLPLKKPFIISIIVGSIGGAIGGAFGTANYAFGASGIFGIPSTIGPGGIDSTVIGGIISVIISLILGFLITYVVMKKETAALYEYEEKTK